MKLIKSASILLSCIIVFSLGSVMGGEQENLADTKEYREAVHLLEIWIESILDFDRLPGVSIAVVHDQDIVYTKGFGYADVQKGVKATPDTKYVIASISKQFTALAIMQLRDKGKLNLDDPVSNYLDWFAPEFDGADVSQPTIADLLRHSSGLPTEPDWTVWSDPGKLYPAREDFIERIRNIKLSYSTNTQFNYSNTGYALLGEIVSVVSEMNYEDYVKRNILDPLHLDNTTPNAHDRGFRRKAATGYGRWPRNGERVEIPSLDTGAMLPAAGFGSTVNDLAKFAMWQFRILDGQDTDILKRETLREMQSVQWEDPKWGYGFTYWYLGDLDIIGHQGGAPGYRSQIILSPEEKIAVVVMYNAYDAPQWGTAMNSYEIMARALRPAENTENEKKTAGWEKYTGYYTADRTWSEAAVLEWDGALALLWLPAGRPINSLIKLSHIEGHVFRQVRGDGSLGKHFVFETDDNGNITAMKFNNNILQKTVR
ncbi:serine hydrolase domain-containing protein [Candidatus Neomarinimicrobiota bacterium]